MQYEIRFAVTVAESPFRSGWYAKIDLEGDIVESVNSTLTGTGPNAVAAVQNALGNLASSTPYPQLLIEAALMRNTRTNKRLSKSGK
jgi:hypothetical protein